MGWTNGIDQSQACGLRGWVIHLSVDIVFDRCIANSFGFTGFGQHDCEAQRCEGNVGDTVLRCLQKLLKRNACSSAQVELIVPSGCR